MRRRISQSLSTCLGILAPYDADWGHTLARTQTCSYRIVCGIFNVPRKLESLIICGCNYKGQHFLVSYKKTLCVSPAGLEFMTWLDFRRSLESGHRWCMLLPRTKAGTRVRWSAVKGQMSVRSWWKKSKSSERFIFLLNFLVMQTVNQNKGIGIMTRVLNEMKDYLLYLMIAHGVILILLRNKRVKNISIMLGKNNNNLSDLDSPFPFLSITNDGDDDKQLFSSSNTLDYQKIFQKY